MILLDPKEKIGKNKSRRLRARGDRRYSTWYEPSDTPEDIKLGVHFTLSQTPVANNPTPCDHRLWELVFEAGESFKPMSEEEQLEAIEYAQAHGFSPLFPE